MSDTAGNVTLERRDQVALITLDRPAKLNAFDQPMWEALGQILKELAAQPPRAVVVTGAGDAFCAGHDIHPESPLTAAMAKGMFAGDPEPVRQTLVQLKGTLGDLAALPVPTIAAINGKAYSGGVEIALVCDLRVMDSRAAICLQETRLGMMPDLGGTVRMQRLIGRARALELIYTSRKVEAEEALALGLVNRVTPAGSCLDAALELAAEIAINGPAALGGVKRVALRMDDLEQALAEETDQAVRCILSGEPAEGVAAWMARRPPRFK
jgi:enoyl-CoA hydratase/carnithine racemase